MHNNKPGRVSGNFTYKKTSSEIICQNIGVTTQTIFQDYRCTYKEKISYFGRLYIGEEHIMFVSNMFGKVKKIAISISSIERLEEKDSKSISVSACIVGHNSLEQFLFTGLSTNHAYKLINAVWKKQKLEPSIVNNEEEKENFNMTNDIQHLDSSQVEINLFNASGAEKERVKMLEIVLPCSVEQFYNFFLADNALLYGRKKHLQLKKAHSIEITPWKRQEELNAETREITAIIKVKGVPLMNEARMNQVCILTKNQRKQINLKVLTNMGDVPYHSYFNCQEHITVTIQADYKCKYTVYAAVIFNKSTYMKNHIVNKTFEDFNQEYKFWSDNCKSFLQAKKLQCQQKIRKEGRKSQQSRDVEFESTKTQSQQKELQTQKQAKQKDAFFECLNQLKQVKIQLQQVKTKIKRQNLFLFICMIAIIAIGIIEIRQTADK